MPHKDREQRLACIRDHHRKHRPSPTPLKQPSNLPPVGGVRTTEDKIQCHICGRWFGALTMHIIKLHRMTVDDYKHKYGIARNTPLWSPATIELQRKSAIARDQGSVGRAVLATMSRPDPALLRGVNRRLESRVSQSKQRLGRNGAAR